MMMKDALQHAAKQLHDIPESSKEATTLLAFLLKKDASWLLAHDRDVLDEATVTAFESLVARRAAHEPMAYIIGIQPFYGHDFIVTPAVLIPRPESELIIDALKNDFADRKDITIVDVGTGSGCLAISAALAFPQARVIGLDISPNALRIAEQNKARLHAPNVLLAKSDLLDHCLKNNIKADAILANLPYLPQQEIDESPTRGELLHEPQSALLADDQGLALMKDCLTQAAQVLKKDGKMYLEMLPWQIPLMRAYTNGQKFKFGTETLQDISGRDRILVLTSLVGPS